MMQSLLRATLTGVLRSPQRHTAVLTKLSDVQSCRMEKQRNMSSRPFQKMKSIDNLILKQGIQLPYITNLKGVDEVRIEYITRENGEGAWTTLKGCIEAGQGYSADELEPLDEFLDNAETQRNYFQVMDQSNNKVIAVFLHRRCPLARSEMAVHFSWLTAVSPDYRNKGFGQRYSGVFGLDLGRVILGHLGFPVGRSTMGRSIHALHYAGFNLIGTIPNCSKIEGVGWMTDAIFSSLDKNMISEALKKIPEPELPPLVVSDVVPTSLQSDKPPLTNFPPLAINGGSLAVEVASSQDVWKVEEMIRQAAQKGEGFALDEFNVQGHFNRALLYDSHVVTVKTNDDSIVAAAIFGPTKLCRAYNPQQVGGYIIVNEDYRKKGVGKAFTSYLIKQAKAAGYTYILTDAFCLNVPGQKILESAGFSVTGSMPQCGHMKGQGFSDSFVCYLNMT